MVATKDTSIENIRVIGIYAHIDAGKTTTSEAILYQTGRIHRVGRVDDGNTQLDWMEQERARGITITAAATSCYWRGCRLNLIDTPGHIDFTAEVVRSIRVIDGAVIVLCGVGGVETQTETVWRHADQQALPRLLFVNKLDREGADFAQVMADVRERLSPNAMPLQIPIGCGTQFSGIVDLLERRALVWRAGSDEAAVGPVPLALQPGAAAARAALVDAICETDDALLAEHIEGREPGLPALRLALRRATISGKLLPVLCGSAKERIGIQPLLDAIVAYLPSPAEAPPVIGAIPGSQESSTRSPGQADPLCASAFKIVSDPHVGHLSWVRIFSGELETGNTVYNPRTGRQERVARIYRLHANRREHVGRTRAGDVVALVGLKSAVTGDTLCDPAHPISLESFRFPEPVIAVALAPACEEERDRLHQAVLRLSEEDPTLLASFDAETGEQILAGMGELHMEIAVDRLRSEFGLVAQASDLQVAYRETVRHRAEATGSYRKQTGGHGHFAVARLRVEPLPRGHGIIFESVAPPLEVSAGYVRAVEAGMREALEKGVLAGYPLTDLRVTLLGGKFHEVDSNSLDFRIAGSMAVRQAVQQAKPVLLEPVMQASINVDEAYLGAVMADLGRRRGKVTGVHVRGKMRVINGEAPLAEARGYATDLRNMTQGRGSFTLEFSRYELVPERLSAGIAARRQDEGKILRR